MLGEWHCAKWKQGSFENKTCPIQACTPAECSYATALCILTEDYFSSAVAQMALWYIILKYAYLLYCKVLNNGGLHVENVEVFFNYYYFFN